MKTANQKTNKFAFVSNSAEIANAVKNCLNPETDEMVIELATMEEAVPVAKKLLDTGIEVILGGGGTGSLLMQTIGQPIIKIARTYLDILNALIEAKNHGLFIGLTSFASPTYGIEIFEDILSIKVHHIVFNTTNELKTGIRKAVKAGVDCVVGGGICKHIVNSLGREGIVVLPSTEVIRQALNEARAVASARRKEKEDTKQLQTILQNIKEGVIVIDNDGNVKTFNQMASDILDIKLKQGIGQPLPETMNEIGLLEVLSTGKPEIDQIRSVGKVDIVINSLPIEVDGKIRGVVATFKEAARIQAIDRKVREQLYFKGLVAKYTISQFQNHSLKMKEMIQKAKIYAQTDETILIKGETGSGKEFLAHSLHNLSKRKNNAFVAVNCSALTESLLESELFGYEEGAFTGARKGGKIGLFELANGGTIFLDEIADIPQNVQIRLLRVLEEKEVMRVGGDRYVPVDLRVISSTFKELSREVRLGTFRRDLFFRLSVLKLNLPPLRERPKDIPYIARKLLNKYNKGLKKITEKSIKILQEYYWPGNIRELDSFIKLYAILLGNSVSDEHLVRKLLAEFRKDHRVLQVGESGLTYKEPPDNAVKTLKDRVEAYEAKIIQDTLKQFNKKETAKKLGISVNTLWRKLNTARLGQ
jgi:propionate catabolism operon transcriptional regulator